MGRTHSYEHSGISLIGTRKSKDQDQEINDFVSSPVFNGPDLITGQLSIRKPRELVPIAGDVVIRVEDR